MRSRIVHPLAAGIFAVVLAVAPAAAQPPERGAPASDATCTQSLPEDTATGITAVRQGASNVICVNWHRAEGKQKRVRETRFTARAPVTVHVYRFNFLRFDVQYNVEEEAVESYRALEKLWSQVFIFVPTQAEAALAPDPFDAAAIRWLRGLDAANAKLDSILATWTKPGLSQAEVDSIARVIPWAEGRITHLGELLREVNQVLDANPDLEDYGFYESRLPKHERVVERLRAFVAAAGQTRDGKREVVRPSASGTIVTVTMVARNQNQVQQGRPVTLEYFVESRMPVVFHTGMSWTGLRDVEFEQVRALNDQDLWAKTKDDETSTDLTAFLSYPISALSLDAGPLNLALLPTIGTELSSPGKTIFLGGTLQVARRLFITGGYASGEVAEEGDAVIERVGTELETRELFDVITRRRAWGPYISISFGVID